MGWQSLSDEDLLDCVRRMADVCVRVVNMSPEERRRVEPKRGTSPEQAATLSAALVMQGLAECERRGLAL